MTAPSKLAAYSDLFERLGDITLLIEPGSYNVVEANPACEKAFGVPIETLIGQNILQWIQPDQHEEFAKSLRVAMRRFHPREFESKWTIGEKTHMMDLLICPLVLSDESQVLQVIARDITFEWEAKTQMAELVKKLEVANERLQIMSTTDEMTKLFNFRYFKQRLEEEHARCYRYGDIYSIIFCDIDHFKHYNDRNGHPAGDALLKEMARVIKENVRNVDFCARYGGEEFVVLCPATPSVDVKIAAERIREAVANFKFIHGENQPMGHMSLSIGIADFPTAGKSSAEVLEHADQALYYSKKSGRNRITTYNDIAHISPEHFKKTA